ncbi:MAG: FG-GAP-like repeat-containing protein [Thermoplasmata archaeon]
MRNSAVIMTILLLALSALTTPASGPSFENGGMEAIVELLPPHYSTVANLRIPSGVYFSGAVLSITGMASAENESAYPANITIALNNTVLWAFRETGFGPLGMQDRFTTGEKAVLFAFDSQGGIRSISLRLPLSASVETASMDIICLPPPDDYELVSFNGVNDYDQFGWSVSGAGDLNGDGYDDVIVGSKGYDSPEQEAGRAYIYFGGPKVDRQADSIFTGAMSEYLGCSVSRAGDVNGDGLDDVLVGAYGSCLGEPMAGAAFLYFGKQNMNQTPDVIFLGKERPDEFGYSVSGAGDVNGDGYDDIIIGARRGQMNGKSIGAAYIFFGGQSMDNAPDVSMLGSGEYNMFGSVVSGAGDVNGDGYDDVIVGEPGNDAVANNAGRAFIFFGGSEMDGAADVVISGRAADDNLGHSVSGAGDVNGDGYGDVIVGAPNENAGAADNGRAYIFFGGDPMDSVADIVLSGEAMGDQFGSSVSGAGDLNGDGYDDVAVVRNREGNESTYVYFGGASMDGAADFRFTGGGASPERVRGAGDVNGDGYDDIIVGDLANQATRSPGRAFVYTTHHDNPGGILDPRVSIGSETVWSRQGVVNGSFSSGDLAAVLNDFLRSATCSTADSYGNSYVEVPVRASAGNDGRLELSGLRIVYQYSASIPDFANPLNKYLTEHQWDRDAEGNVPVPLEIRSEGAGRIRLFGLNLTRDEFPELIKEIPETPFYEDSLSVTLVDLYSYFRDDVDAQKELNFSIGYSTNSSFVRVWIWSNRYVAVDSWTGDSNDNWTGTVEARVSCTDRWGQRTDSNEFVIVIGNVNDGPVIVSSPPLVAEPGQIYYYNVTAEDGDGDAVSYSLAEAPLNMTIDRASGRIQWLPRKQGAYRISIVVSDGAGSEEQNYTLSVPNRPPRITSEPELHALTYVPYLYKVTAEDDNLDPVAYNISAKGDGVDIETDTNRLEFVPIVPGEINVSVRASDGVLESHQNFIIEVLQGNHAPEFRSAPPTVAYVEWPYVYRAEAFDVDSDTLVYSLEAGPENMSVDAASGEVTWVPKHRGNFTVALKVSDGRGGEARQNFTIEVLDAVRPSIILDSPEPGRILTGRVTFSGSVVRGTRDVLYVQMRVDGNDWRNATGTLNWTISLNTKALKNGRHLFEFRAFDGVEHSNTFSAVFRVENPPNRAGLIPGAGDAMVLAAIFTALLLAVRKRALRM